MLVNVTDLMERRSSEQKKPRLHVEFFQKPIEDVAETKKHGRPIYRDVDYCRIRVPGDKNKIIEQPAHVPTTVNPETGERLTYAQRFPEHFRLYKQGVENQEPGTPLSELAFLTAAKRKELNGLGIFTAEQLANLSDASIRRLGMGGRGFVEQARTYIDAAENKAPLTALADENADLRDRLATLEKMMGDMAGRAPTAEPPRPADMERSSPPAAESNLDEIEDDGRDLGPGADFAKWDDDTIRAWLEDQGRRPHHKLGHEKLVDMARRVVIERQQKAA